MTVFREVLVKLNVKKYVRTITKNKAEGLINELKKHSKEVS